MGKNQDLSHVFHAHRIQNSGFWADNNVALLGKGHDIPHRPLPDPSPDARMIPVAFEHLFLRSSKESNGRIREISENRSYNVIHMRPYLMSCRSGEHPGYQTSRSLGLLCERPGLL